jgi:hypothetical protein
MINPASTLIIDNLEDADTVASAFLIATANCLDLTKEGIFKPLIRNFSNRVKSYGLPTVILGMGIQAKFLKSIEESKSFQLFDYDREFLELIGRWQAAPVIGVRGKVTQMTCQNSGVDSCVSTGCPSLLISRDLNLGKTLSNKWKNVQKRLESSEIIKVAMALPATQDPMALKMFTDLLLDIHEEHDAIFVLQAGYDILHLKDAMKKRTLTKPVVTKKYNNSEEWIDDISQVDLVVSTIIHGGMAGIAAGTPTVVIPTDFCILELVEAMMIPHLPLEQVAKEKGDNVGSILKHAKYQDFQAFERNQRDKI